MAGAFTREKYCGMLSYMSVYCYAGPAAACKRITESAACISASGDAAVHGLWEAETAAESQSRFHHQVAVATAVKWPVRTPDAKLG